MNSSNALSGHFPRSNLPNLPSGSNPTNFPPESNPPNVQGIPAPAGQQGTPPVSPLNEVFRLGLYALMNRNANRTSPGTPGASPSGPAPGFPSGPPSSTVSYPRVVSPRRQTMPPLRFDQGSPFAADAGVKVALVSPSGSAGSFDSASTGSGARASVPPPPHDQPPPPVPTDLPPPVSYVIGQTSPYVDPASLPAPTREVTPPPALLRRGTPADGSDSPLAGEHCSSGEDVSHSGSTGGVPAPRAEDATSPRSWAQPLSGQASRGKQARFLASRLQGAASLPRETDAVSPKPAPLDAGMASPPVLSPRGRARNDRRQAQTGGRASSSGEDSSSSGMASTQSVSDGSPKPTVSLSTSISAASIAEEPGATQAALPSGWSTIQTMPDVHDYETFVMLLTQVIENRLPRNPSDRCILTTKVVDTAGRGEFRVVPENHARLDVKQIGFYEDLLESDKETLRKLISGYSPNAGLTESGKRKSWGKISRALEGKKNPSEPVSPRQQSEDVVGDLKLPAIQSAVVPRSVNLGGKASPPSINMIVLTGEMLRHELYRKDKNLVAYLVKCLVEIHEKYADNAEAMLCSAEELEKNGNEVGAKRKNDLPSPEFQAFLEKMAKEIMPNDRFEGSKFPRKIAQAFQAFDKKILSSAVNYVGAEESDEPPKRALLAQYRKNWLTQLLNFRLLQPLLNVDMQLQFQAVNPNANMFVLRKFASAAASYFNSRCAGLIESVIRSNDRAHADAIASLESEAEKKSRIEQRSLALLGKRSNSEKIQTGGANKVEGGSDDVGSPRRRLQARTSPGLDHPKPLGHDRVARFRDDIGYVDLPPSLQKQIDRTIRKKRALGSVSILYSACLNTVVTYRVGNLDALTEAELTALLKTKKALLAGITASDLPDVADGAYKVV
jgi:hypothetical protein